MRTEINQLTLRYNRQGQIIAIAAFDVGQVVAKSAIAYRHGSAQIGNAAAVVSRVSGLLMASR